MNDDINFRKLLEEDERFKEYVKDTLFEITLLTPESREVLKAFHSFYNIGVTPKAAAQWTRSMNSYDGPENE